jgi:hypothetical protein
MISQKIVRPANKNQFARGKSKASYIHLNMIRLAPLSGR